MKNKSLNDKGFSLIELIVAVLIMAIIAGAAIFAYSSLFATEIKAASLRVTDCMKQAKTNAMALANDLRSAGTYYETDIYAKFYVSDDSQYISICSGTGLDTDTVLFDNKVGDGVRTQFCKVKPSGDLEPVNENDSDKVFVYFKKSTGGIAGFKVVSASGGTSRYLSSELKVIKVSNEAKSKSLNVIMVDITGRCYIDE